MERSMAAFEQLAPLREHDLFSTLSAARFEKLSAHIHALTLYSEQLLFRQGEVADRFFLIISGQIKLFRFGPDREERVIEVIGPQQTFGEAIMFLERQYYPVYAQALQDCQLMSISNQHYMALLREHPRSCFKLLAKLSRRLHQRINEIESLTQQNTTARVGGYLLNQSRSNAERNEVVKLQAPKRVIASQLGMKPETFSRALATLARQRVLSVKGPEITILDQAQLIKYAGRSQAPATTQEDET